MTEGSGKSVRAECNVWSVACTTSAFSLSTRTSARRVGTTQSGSKLAFSTRALLIVLGRLSRAVGEPATPVQVGDQVGRLGRVAGVAVHGDEPEAQVLGVGQRQERAAAPPPGSSQDEQLSDRGHPQR